MQDPAAQARAARKKAGLWDPFPRGVLSITGKDRARFLHNLLSHDIKGLQEGQQRPACLLDRQGKMRFFCVVHARPDEMLLEMDPKSLPAARELLQKYLISEAVEIQDATTHYRILALYGPDAAALLTPGPRFIAQADWPGLPGFTLWMEAGSTEKPSAPACGPEAFELLRIEAGVPWPGKEIGPSVILNELGEQAPVSFTKGCFIGQEIVARIKYRAHPPRLLTGFVLEGDGVPEPGNPILLGTEPAGIVTSACLSPTLQRPIALGFLNFGVSADLFSVPTPRGPQPARSAALPFVR